MITELRTVGTLNEPAFSATQRYKPEAIPSRVETPLGTLMQRSETTIAQIPCEHFERLEELTMPGSYQSVAAALERAAVPWPLLASEAQKQAEDPLTSRYAFQKSQVLTGVPTVRPSWQAPRDFTPYKTLIRELIEREQIGAARRLFATASLELLTDTSLTSLQQVLAPARVMVIKKADVDRAREYRWLATHANRYRGQWVALDGEALLAHAPSLKELREVLKTLAAPKPPLVHYID